MSTEDCDYPWLVCSERHLLQRQDGSLFHSRLPAGLPEATFHTVFHSAPAGPAELPASLAVVNTEPDISGCEWVGLRSLLNVLPESEFQLGGKGLQLARWYFNHQYCGRCGRSTRLDLSEPCLACDDCELLFYPKISPCVIGLVIRGNECLLARGDRHPESMFSTLAGFIEPGETAEQAFAREVMEETGISVDNIRYFSSQPWPFPSQFMIGFVADYAGGEIEIDNREILEAHWFPYDNLPLVPPESTISGQLIQHFVHMLENR